MAIHGPFEVSREHEGLGQGVIWGTRIEGRGSVARVSFRYVCAELYASTLYACN